MPNLGRISVIAAAGIGGFALLLLIISVGTVLWLDDGNGSSVGLFRKCYADSVPTTSDYGPGCYNANQVTQGGLSVFGLLLLAFGVITAIASLFVDKPFILFGALIQFYFASMFVMAAYATWGTYSRDPSLYVFPYATTATALHTSMGASYHLCVASHYFLWTALTILAFAAGHSFGAGRNAEST